MGAQFFVNAALVALGEEEKVGLAEGGQERIGVAGLNPRAVVQSEEQIVGIDLPGQVGGPFKKARARLLENDARPVFFVDRHNLDGGRARMKSAHDQAGRAAQGVHAQKRVGRTMVDAHKAVGFIFGQDHKVIRHGGR